MPLPTEYQSFIHLSRYARWNYSLKRRESWEETVDRLVGFPGPAKVKEFLDSSISS